MTLPQAPTVDLEGVLFCRSPTDTLRRQLLPMRLHDMVMVWVYYNGRWLYIGTAVTLEWRSPFRT